MHDAIRNDGVAVYTRVFLLLLTYSLGLSGVFVLSRRRGIDIPDLGTGEGVLA